MKAMMIVMIGALTFATCGSRNTEEKHDGVLTANLGWDIVLTGKVAHPQAGKIYINELRNDRPGWKDSIELRKDNTFEKKVHLSEAGYFGLNFYNRQMVNLILNKSNVTINADGAQQEGSVEIKGSPEQDLVNAVQAMIATAQNTPEMTALKEDYTRAGQADDNVRVTELQGKYMDELKKQNDKIAAYLLLQPASLATVEILSQGNILTKDDYPAVFADAAEKLKKEMPNSVFVKPFLLDVERSQATAIGAMAPEISLPDPAGNVVSLSTLRGKYVLVDFWAKWCGPCRRENPNVVRVYHRFKGKGFEVFGVSLDRSKADWVQAIKEDGLVWSQVLDLQSVAAKEYNVNAIPFSILVDPKGVIVAKNLRGAALEKKLAEVLGE